MKLPFAIADCRLPIENTSAGGTGVMTVVSGVAPGTRAQGGASLNVANAFTLVEVMVVMVLLSLIVLVLMAVFSSTQTAFRASVTQAGVLEDGRATMDLIAADLRTMTPSDGAYRYVTGRGPYPTWGGSSLGPPNFVCLVVPAFAPPGPPTPLFQPMVGGSSVRTNVLENFFFLSKNNLNGTPSWIGTGYAVNTNLPDGTPYPLYRFYMVTNTVTGTPESLFTNFTTFQFTNTAVWSHLMDGVVSLTVRPYDMNGVRMTGITNGFNFVLPEFGPPPNVLYLPPQFGEVGCWMFSNAVPASVQIEMGVLEDRAMQRAESLPNAGANSPQARYLAGCAGQVHVFRQRVSIPNVDPSAYQ